MPAKGIPTSARVAAAINELFEALLEEYHGDFSFSVLGEGRVVAASNMIHGNIEPEVAK